jgi:hypothetical protein
MTGPERHTGRHSGQHSSNEEEYFARREAELMRQQRDLHARERIEAERRSHHMKCPNCGYDLITGTWDGIRIDQCTNCHGLWLGAAEAKELLKHPRPNVLARIFRAVIKGVAGAKASDV